MRTRKSIAAILVFGLTVMGAPVSLMAQGVQQGSVSGEALDAGGRPLANIRVELFEAINRQPLGVALQTTLTGSQGDWTFTHVDPGEYVVQIVVNGHIAGIPVSVGAGTMLGGVLIVAPSAATPDPIAGAALATLIAAIAGAALVTTVVITRGGRELASGRLSSNLQHGRCHLAVPLHS